MIRQRFTEQFETMCDAATRLAKWVEADALIFLIEEPELNWQRLATLAGDLTVLIAADVNIDLSAAQEAGLIPIQVEMEDRGTHDRLSQALLEAVADDKLKSGARVVSLYSGFEAGIIDSISVMDLGEHLGRLTARDLQQLETSVPLDTMQLVVNLALEVGREGREGKPVGTLFVVGDSRKVMAMSHPTGFDPVKGYSRKERNLKSARVREGVKEFAQLDGAIVISNDGTVEGAARYLDAPATDLSLSKGLGARHWSAAAISKATKAVAVAVSETNGTVRIFQGGKLVLRIAPYRRPLKWREFEFEPPTATE